MLNLSLLPDWSGQTVIVVGGGPSLSLDQLWLAGRASGLGRAKVAVLTRAYEICPQADLLYAHDQWFWRKYPDAWRFKGLKFCGQQPPDGCPAVQIPLLPRGAGRPFADPKLPIHAGVEGCADSGYHLIQLLALCGVARQLLAGFDCKANGRWHDGYPERSFPDYEKAIQLHRELKPLLSCEVINCSPFSAIDAYPIGKLETVL